MRPFFYAYYMLYYYRRNRHGKEVRAWKWIFCCPHRKRIWACGPRWRATSSQASPNTGRRPRRSLKTRPAHCTSPCRRHIWKARMWTVALRPSTPPWPITAPGCSHAVSTVLYMWNARRKAVCGRALWALWTWRLTAMKKAPHRWCVPAKIPLWSVFRRALPCAGARRWKRLIS